MEQDKPSAGDDPSGNSLKEAVLDAALKIIDRDGLLLGPESVSYAKVFAYLEQEYGIKVTRGSVHERIWASHADFRLDVLVAMASMSESEPLLGRHGVMPLLAKFVPAGSTPAEGLLLAAKDLPVGLAERLVVSPDYLRGQSIRAMASRLNEPATADAVSGIFGERERIWMTKRHDRFAMAIGALGLRIKPRLGLSSEDASDIFFGGLWMLLSSTALNSSAGCSAVMQELATDLGAGVGGRPWTPLSVGVRALLEFLVEIDPSGVEASDMTDIPPLDAPHGPVRRPWSDDVVTTKAARRSRGELKQLVLRGGLEILLRDGLHLRPESLSYAAVFAQVYADRGLVVNRASVHKRFWSSHQEFCLDVMRRALLVEAPVDAELMAAADEVPPAVGPDGSEHRIQTALNTIQVISSANLRMMLGSPVLLRRLLIKAAISEQPDSPARDALRQTVADMESATVVADAKVLDAAVLRRRFDVRPQLDLGQDEALEIFAIVFHVASIGVAFDSLGAAESKEPSFKLPRADDGGVRDEWSLLAIITGAAFRFLFQERSP